MRGHLSRRQLLQAAGIGVAAAALPRASLTQQLGETSSSPLEEFGYNQIAVRGARQVAQRENVTTVLMGLNEDSLLKPFREMAGAADASTSLGGWYEWKPDYNRHHDDAGLAPGATFGQWTSALSRLYAASRFDGEAGRTDMSARVLRLHGLLAGAIAPSYFAQTRFPGYSFDKLACGLMDAHRLAGDGNAFSTLNKVADAAGPELPGHAIDREVQWKMGADISWMWDETYTLPENLYLLSAMGAGERYRRMAEAYLNDSTYFEPLSRGVNVLADKQAYSYVNALCSAMQAYFVGGSTMHLGAARHGFEMLERQSFATGGWGPDELLRKPGYDELAKSLTASHNGFETPCGSYAHMKLTRYLLRATRDGRYGDSMERVLHNTVLGSLPLQADGRSFYSSDYNVTGRRVYSVHRWPCCSGTLPQVVADYGINTYLHEPGAVWVNLYQPSELRCGLGDAHISLSQTGSYPQEHDVRLHIGASRPAAFSLYLRVPAWAANEARLRINGAAAELHSEKGFAALHRVWKDGDRIELDLPMRLRLEALPANEGVEHPETVALLRGPLVLFALREPGDSGPLIFERDALLRAVQTGSKEWTAQSAVGPRRLVPFTDVGDREYSTYLTLA